MAINSTISIWNQILLNTSISYERGIADIVAKQKISDSVYLAKGIGISLVVIGHFYFPKYQPEWWLYLRKMIYLYHMPLFMVLAGFLYKLTTPLIPSLKEYKIFIKKKVKRLMVPYLVLGISMALLKLIFQKYSTLGQPVDNQFFMYLLFNPESDFTADGGYARFLWFIYTLFVILSIFPLLEKICKNYIIILIIVFLLNYFKYPPYFCIDHAVHYLPFFTLGVIANNYLLANINEKSNLYKVLYLSIVAVIFFTALLYNFDANCFLLKYLIGFFFSISILFVFYLVRIDNRFIGYKFMKSIGIHSATIYLFHFIFMSPFIFIIYGYFEIPKNFFAPLIVATYLVGTQIPIMIEKHIMSRSKVLMAIFLGK